MKRLILLCLLLLPSTLFAETQLAWMNPYIAGSGGSAAVSCSASTDYVGTKLTTGSTNAGSADKIRCNRYTPTQSSGCSSGSLAAVYLYHTNTSAEEAKMAIFTSSADTPQSTDAIVGSWVTLSSSAVEWATGTASGSVTIGNNYWVCHAVGTGEWSRAVDTTTGTAYYATITYASPPTTFDGLSFLSGTSTYRMYATIGP